MAEAKQENQNTETGSKKLAAGLAQEKRRELAFKRAKRMIANLIIIIIISTIIGIGLSTIGMQQVFIFILIGLMPGIVANITDGRPGRFASKTVVAFNIAGMLQYLVAIFVSGTPNEIADNLILKPEVWLMIYGFAAFGWALVFIVPHIVQLYLEITANYTVKKLLSFQETLVKEWGETIIHKPKKKKG